MSKRDALWVVFFLFMGCLGFATFSHFYERAFPAASLNFRLTRNQAYDAAEHYMRTMGYDTKNFQSAHIFSSAGLQQVFLERSLGLAETNHLVRDWLSVWYWHIRWFKPLDKEELHLRLDPGGRIVGFEHRILESDAGARLSQDAALVLTETYLSETQGFALTDFERIEAATTERPERLDHAFTYRKRDFAIGDDGHYRLHVVIQGDRIGRFSEYLHVPETFARNYTETRARAGMLTQIASVLSVALFVAMCIVLMQKYRSGDLRWHGAMVVGVLAATVALVTALNSYPLSLFSYNTTQSFVSFITTLIFGGLLGAVLQGGTIVLSGATGGAVAQEVLHRGQYNPLSRLSLRNMRSSAFAQSTLVGYGLAFAHLGYLTLFYILGTEYLGFWVPARVAEYSNTYSTLLPWIYPLFIGLIAAASEEFIFRLLAISLLIRWTGRRWLAVLLPAVVWAFLHANYPQEPIYIRGLELTVVGVIFGLVFLRYGIWATVISHYVYNAFVSAYPMVQADSLYFQISGLLVIFAIFIPALPAIFRTLTRQYREDENAIETQPETPLVSQPEATSPPASPVLEPEIARKTPEDYLVSKRHLMIVGALALIGLGLYAGFYTPPIREYAKELTITRDEAVQIADQFRKHLGFEGDGYRRTAWFNTSLGSPHLTHLMRHTDLALADTLVAHETGTWRWTVRWFKPLEKEELLIHVNGRGNICGLVHSVPENQPGAMLETDEAEKRAIAFLATHFNRDVTDLIRYKRLAARSHKREARIDHMFEWERTDIKVADGEFRVVATVLGDQIGSVSLRYRAPEAFLRQLSERSAKHAIYNALSAILIIATLALAIVYFLRAYRDGKIAWRLPTILAIISTSGFAIDKINNLPGLYEKYATSKAHWTFLTGEILGFTMSLALIFLLSLILVALGQVFFREQKPGEMQPADWLDVCRLKTGNAALWFQAIFIALCYLMFSMGMHEFSGYLLVGYLQSYIKSTVGAMPILNSYVPAISTVTKNISMLSILPFAIIAALFTWWKFLHKPSLLVFLVLLALFVKDQVMPAQDLYHFGMRLITWGLHTAVLTFLVLRIFRFNLLFYLVFFWISMSGMGWHLMQMQHLFYQINGMMLMALSLLPLAFALWVHQKQRLATV